MNYSNGSSMFLEATELPLLNTTETGHTEGYGVVLVTVVVMLCTFSVVGVIGNAIAFYIFWRRRTASTSVTFILALAGVDFITCLVTIPYTVTFELLQYRLVYDLACKTYMFLITSTVPFSAYIMVGIALDRYFCICHPFLYAFTVPRAKVVIFCMGIPALTLGVITALSYGTYIYDWKLVANMSQEYNITDMSDDKLRALGHHPNLELTDAYVKAGGSGLTAAYSVYTNVTVFEYVKHFGMCVNNNFVFSQRFLDVYKIIHACGFLVAYLSVAILYILIYKSIFTRRANKARRKKNNLYPSSDTKLRGTNGAEETQMTVINGAETSTAKVMNNQTHPDSNSCSSSRKIELTARNDAVSASSKSSAPTTATTTTTAAATTTTTTTSSSAGTLNDVTSSGGAENAGSSLPEDETSTLLPDNKQDSGGRAVYGDQPLGKGDEKVKKNMFAHGEGELSRDTMTSFLGNEGHVMTPSNSQDEPDVNEVKGIQESSCNNNFAVEEHAVKENMDDDDDDDDDDGCDGIASGKERKIDDENENENGDDVNGHLNNEDTPPEERPLLSPEAPSTMTDNANNTKLNSSARNSSSSPPPSTLPVKPTFIDVPVCNTQPAESKTKVFKKHTAGKHLQIDAQTNSIKRKRPSTVRDRNLIANIKTAFMLFIVTLVFIIAFLPALLMANSLIPFNMVVFYGYFVYNVANPFIYAFMNQTFREDVKRIIKLCSR